MSDLGKRIYNIRKCHINMTQNELITAINSRFGMNLSRNMLSNWERGKQKPGIEVLIAISEILGVSTDYLLKGKKEADYNEKIFTVIDDSMEIKSIEDIARLGAHKKIWDEKYIDFCYKIPVNNMVNANIYSGDYILFHIQKKLNDGDIGIFSIDGNLYVKRYYNHNGEILLVDECIGSRPVIIKNNQNFAVLGKAVSVKREL